MGMANNKKKKELEQQQTLLNSPPVLGTTTPPVIAQNATVPNLLPEGHPDTVRPAWLDTSAPKKKTTTTSLLDMLNKQPDIWDYYKTAMEYLKPVMEQRRQQQRDELTQWLSQRGILDSGITLDQLTSAEQQLLADMSSQAMGIAMQQGEMDFARRQALANLGLQQQQMDLSQQRWQSEFGFEQQRWQNQLQQQQMENALGLWMNTANTQGFYPRVIPPVLQGTIYEPLLRSVAGQQTNAYTQQQFENELALRQIALQEWQANQQYGAQAGGLDIETDTYFIIEQLTRPRDANGNLLQFRTPEDRVGYLKNEAQSFLDYANALERAGRITPDQAEMYRTAVYSALPEMQPKAVDQKTIRKARTTPPPATTYLDWL